MPTLVISGEEDELTPSDESRTWASEIPGAQYVEIEKAGHLSNLEAPRLSTMPLQPYSSE